MLFLEKESLNRIRYLINSLLGQVPLTENLFGYCHPIGGDQNGTAETDEFMKFFSFETNNGGHIICPVCHYASAPQRTDSNQLLAKCCGTAHYYTGNSRQSRGYQN